MKKGKIIAIGFMITTLLTGCVDYMPEMTQEQTDLISEYAADLLLKYSPNFKNRLVDVETLVYEEAIEEQTTESIEEESKEEKTSEASENEADEKKESSAEETDTQQDNPVDDELPYIEDIDLAVVFGLKDVSIKFKDIEICGMYPTDSAVFAVSPGKDKQLMVVHYILENITDQTVTCDLFDVNLQMNAVVDGKSYKVMNTLLSNDMTVYIEDVTPDEKKDLVMLFEIEPIDEVPDSLVFELNAEQYQTEY